MKLQRIGILWLWLVGASLLVLAVAFVATINSRREAKIDRITKELAQLREQREQVVLVHGSASLQRFNSKQYQKLTSERKKLLQILVSPHPDDKEVRLYALNRLRAIDRQLAALDQKFEQAEKKLDAAIASKLEELDSQNIFRKLGIGY